MQKDPQPRLHTSGVSFVQPARPLEPTKFKCSAVENMCARVHHSLAMFFPIRSSANVEQIYFDMKQGLRYVMNETPILAAVHRQDERGWYSAEILPAPHAGVSFHFSDVSNDPKFPTYNDMAECGFPYMDGDLDGLKEFRPDPFPTCEDGQPIFVTKICHIRGAIVWTASLSHLITDLVQGTVSLAAWAKWTKRIIEASGKPVPIPQQLPWPDRKRLLPDAGPPLELEEIPGINKKLGNYMVLDPSDPEKVVEEIETLFTKADVSNASPAQLEYFTEPTSGIWRFTPAKLKALSDAVKRATPDAKLSNFDIVTAFIWQRFYMAKMGNRRDIPKTAKIMTALDVRQKLNPPMPTFLGACVDLVIVTVDSDILKPQSDQAKAIGELSKKVREFGTAWDEKTYMDVLTLSQRTPMIPGMLPTGPVDMLVTAHAGFTAGMRADWGGELGRCTALREPYIAREIPRGEVIIFPKQPGTGDLDVLISAEAIVIERLLSDPAMSTVCENACVRHNVLESFKMIGKRAKL